MATSILDHLTSGSMAQLMVCHKAKHSKNKMYVRANQLEK